MATLLRRAGTQRGGRVVNRPVQGSRLFALTDPVARRQVIVAGLRTIEPGVRWFTTLWRRLLLRRVRMVTVIGSYGKTTTTRMLATALCGSVHRYAGNNAGVFVAHAILRAPPWRHHQVLEVGISGPGQMKRYADMVRPDLVVVTSIGSEHHRSLHTLETTRAEKAKMVEAVPRQGTVFLNGDDANVLWMRERASCRVVTFGLGPANDVRAVEISSLGHRGTTFRCDASGFDALNVETRLLGRPGVYACLATLAVGLHEGLSPSTLLDSIRRTTPTSTRLEPVPLDHGAVLLRDEFKSSYETVQTALSVLEDCEARRKICVMGNVSEPPEGMGKTYRRVGRRIAEVADRVYFLGGHFRRYAAGARQAGMSNEAMVDCGRDVLGTIERLRREIREGDLILIKGRDTERLDRIALGLLGHDVRCDLVFCDAKAVRCHHCPLLERPRPKTKEV